MQYHNMTINKINLYFYILKSSTIPDLTLKRQYYNCYKFTEKEFLNKPVITLTPWDSVTKGAVVTVKCAVEGYTMIP